MYIQRKIIFLFLWLIIFSRSVHALDGSDQEPVEMPAHMEYVPTDTGLMNRLLYYTIGIVMGCVKEGQGLIPTEFDLDKIPRIVPEMIATDLLHEGINAACKAQGIALDNTCHTVKAIEKNSCRLAVYVVVQKMKKQYGCDNEECCGSPDSRWEEKTRVIAEDAAADVMWAGVKDISCEAGLISKIEDISSRGLQTVGLDKLPAQIQTLAKLIVCKTADFVGKGFIKGIFVRPLFNGISGPRFENDRPAWDFSIRFEL